jgi:hypothetical protein
MKSSLTLKDDLPVFAVPALFHLLDILFAVAGGFTVVIPLIVFSSLAHIMLLGLIFSQSAKLQAQLALRIASV